ncbi:MAG TPA: alpha/beta hydrolase [Hyphomicrobiaceae bacterium]|nr:alpha/beta hydrolase [Hyphomicrobiaceae bacterium]
MRTFDVDILIVPGWTNSGPNHWQTRWQARLKTARRVEQDDWDKIDLDRWTNRLVEAVAASSKPVVLVAHSCGVPTVAHAAPRFPDGRVIGAFLVAPGGEAETRAIPGMDARFTPYPRDPLPFPSLLVASSNDPYCSMTEAGELALSWGSALIDAGDAGHINTASGHGPWPEGAMRFGWFLKQLGKAAAR